MSCCKNLNKTILQKDMSTCTVLTSCLQKNTQDRGNIFEKWPCVGYSCISFCIHRSILYWPIICSATFPVSKPIRVNAYDGCHCHGSERVRNYLVIREWPQQFTLNDQNTAWQHGICWSGKNKMGICINYMGNKSFSHLL